jgi:hypothetical protein
MKAAAAVPSLVALGVLLAAAGVAAQRGAANGEWRTWGGDLGVTRYAPLDQINADNFSTLQVAWRFKTLNMGARPDFNLQATPLMINGVLYATVGGSTRAGAPSARHAGCPAAVSATGPTAKATSASSTSPSATSWSASTPGRASRSTTSASTAWST